MVKVIKINVEEFTIDKDGKYIRTGDIIQNEQFLMSEDAEYETNIKAFMLDEIKREILRKYNDFFHMSEKSCI